MSSGRPVRAVAISTDSANTAMVVSQDTSVLGLFNAVGEGNPQSVFLPDQKAILYCNEDGKGRGLAPNPRATRFVDCYIRGFAKADMIMGPVVIVGLADDGWQSDIPKTVERDALKA